jgi:hypothetical protein
VLCEDDSTVYSTYNEIGFNEILLITYILLCPGIFLPFYMVYNEIGLSKISVTTYIYFRHPMCIFQNFNEVTSFALRLHQFVNLRKTMVTQNKGQLRKKLKLLSNMRLVLSVLQAKLSFRWWNVYQNNFIEWIAQRMRLISCSVNRCSWEIQCMTFENEL